MKSNEWILFYSSLFDMLVSIRDLITRAKSNQRIDSERIPSDKDLMPISLFAAMVAGSNYHGVLLAGNCLLYCFGEISIIYSFDIYWIAAGF